MLNVKKRLTGLSTYPEELGLNLESPEHRSKWFLASILFAKRISSDIAKRTYRLFEAEGVTTPEAIIKAGWDKLVELLDSGGYVRYDFSTATKLLEIATGLKERYGSLENLYTQAKDSKDLERRLLEFKGVGPTTVNIFLRELRTIWGKANPPASTLAKEAARRLGLDDEDVIPMEPYLVKLNLEFCKKRKCPQCPVKESCQMGR